MSDCPNSDAPHDERGFCPACEPVNHVATLREMRRFVPGPEQVAALDAAIASLSAPPQRFGMAIIADDTLPPNSIAFISRGKRTVFQLDPSP